jgi:hypothetical protein
MEPLRVTLPQSLRAYLDDLAEREGVTVEQFVASAVAEKVSALETEVYLSKRAAKASRDRYLAALAAAPDVEPPEYDRL